VANRQADGVAPRQRQRGRDRARALRDHARLALDRRGTLALGQRHAELAVARETACAGQDEVAHTCEARQRAGDGAESDRQARHLRQAARDERGTRVLAEAEPVGDAGGDRHDVLQGTAELDPGDVPVRVETELTRAQTALKEGGQRVVARCDDGGGRTPQGHLAREGRARQYRDAGVREPLGDQLAHAQVTLGIEPLRGRDERHVGRNGWQRLERCAHELRGNGDDHDRGARQRLRLIQRRLDRRRHVDVGEVPRAPAPRADAIDDLPLTRPQAHRRSAPRRVDCQRGAPAAAADHRDAHADIRRWPTFGSWPARSRAMFAW